ncbi:MAG: DNA polymerase ligase N-terminal domain-containing protein [Armatimonadia bacterium]
MAKGLEEYRKKRDFARTPEPAPVSAEREAELEEEKRPRVFVIQKHDARALHYDFRLEVDGVLKSWAVPKGPSMDPKDKHLAVPTEDHPLEYAAFEGIIPEGAYGAGEVIVWDGGVYRNLKQEDPKHEPQTMAEGLEGGHATVWLQGKKLNGGFALIRTKRDEKKPSWLLIKMDDAEARPGSTIVEERPESILSGRKIEELATGNEKEWHSERE